MAGQIPAPANTTVGSGGFAAGRAFAKPGDAKGAGGGNLKKPLPTQQGGVAFNKGGPKGAASMEVHYDKMRDDGGTQQNPNSVPTIPWGNVRNGESPVPR